MAADNFIQKVLMAYNEDSLESFKALLENKELGEKFQKNKIAILIWISEQRKLDGLLVVHNYYPITKEEINKIFPPLCGKGTIEMASWCLNNHTIEKKTLFLAAQNSAVSGQLEILKLILENHQETLASYDHGSFLQLAKDYKQEKVCDYLALELRIPISKMVQELMDRHPDVHELFTKRQWHDNLKESLKHHEPAHPKMKI